MANTLQLDKTSNKQQFFTATNYKKNSFYIFETT